MGKRAYTYKGAMGGDTPNKFRSWVNVVESNFIKARLRTYSLPCRKASEHPCLCLSSRVRILSTRSVFCCARFCLPASVRPRTQG